ncbi:MAG: histidine kinase, partial [Zetaproteobacteria bacterium CG_4_8_14_3_um_filter_59_5]
YKVLKAGNGVQAVARFNEHAKDIALCMFDIVMPEMQGDKAAEHIRKTHPAIKIIFCTGYDLNNQTDMRDETVINKPFNIVKMSQLIREKLD